AGDLQEGTELSPGAKSYREEFKACLEDDLNTANAITVLFNVLKADDIQDYEKIKLVEDFEQVLSLGLMKDDETEIHDDLAEYVEEMIQKRQDAKKNKDYQLADAIRAELLEKGIALEDTRQGVNWKRINQ
ncbi:MAG TPA: cysteine--tRNA ligase, partial [Clostridiales bacterium]|nr:cysteine--tRNA ligase [Clostridiales bacterium]